MPAKESHKDLVLHMGSVWLGLVLVLQEAVEHCELMVARHIELMVTVAVALHTELAAAIVVEVKCVELAVMAAGFSAEIVVAVQFEATAYSDPVRHWDY